MKLKSVVVSDMRMCMKEDNPVGNIKGDHCAEQMSSNFDSIRVLNFTQTVLM